MPFKSSLPGALFMFLLVFCTSTLFVSAVVTRVDLGDHLTVYLGSEDNCHGDDNDLIQKANNAFDSLSSLGLSKNQMPTAIALLWTANNKCIYASSARGSGKLRGNPHIQDQVKAALQGLSADPERAHANYARCGEIMVISEWFRQHPGQQLPPQKKIVTVKADGVAVPCIANLRGQARGATFGCRQFLYHMGFNDEQIIDQNVLPFSRRSLCEQRKVRKGGRGTAHNSRTETRKPILKGHAATRGAKYRRGIFLGRAL